MFQRLVFNFNKVWREKSTLIDFFPINKFPFVFEWFDIRALPETYLIKLSDHFEPYLQFFRK